MNKTSVGFLVIILIWLVGCDSSVPEPITLRGETMGTNYTVKVASPLDRSQMISLKNKIDENLKILNDQMSTYLPHSEISRFNQSQSTDWFPVSSEFATVVQTAIATSENTDGAFDVTVGPLVNLWGFGPKKKRKAPTEEEIQEVQDRVGYDKIEVRIEPPALRKQHPNLYLDLSAIAKGYGVDLVAKTIETAGHQNYFVVIGGEVRLKGHKGTDQKKIFWRVGIEAPAKSINAGPALHKAIAVPQDISMATSGNYRNYFEENGKRYSHTIHPQSGRPIEHHLASVTVLDQDCTVADAMATAFMVMGLEASLTYAKKHKLACYFIYKNKEEFSTKATPEFEKILFSK